MNTCKICFNSCVDQELCSSCWAIINILPNDVPTMLRVMAFNIELQERLKPE